MKRDSKSRRRKFQFGLTTLFALVLILSLPLARLSSKLAHKRKERAAVAAIHRLGGEVFYDWQGNDWPEFWQHKRKPAAEPPGSTWLRGIFGDDFFATCTAVDFSTEECEVEDTDLAQLEVLTGLTMLLIHGESVTDSGLAHLAGLVCLEELTLEDTRITNRGLLQLTGLTKLRELFIGRTLLMDVPIAEVEMALPNCKILRWAH